MRQFRLLGAALGAALLVAACGGGGDGDQAPRVSITSVTVVGDSLADSGTFSALGAGSTYGRTFGIQGTSSKIFTELTAASYGISNLCNFYKATTPLADGTVPTFTPNPTVGCTSYGVGGGRINPMADRGGITTPLSVIKQLVDAGTGKTYQSNDLLLVDGGGNDAADLVGLYLAFGSAKGVYDATHAAAPGTAAEAAAATAYAAANTAYATLLSSVLAPASVAATLGTGAAGYASVGGDYMKALADKLFDAVKLNALDKGATHVAIINAPGILKTPRFQMVLDSIAAAYGGGTAGATARAQSEGLFTSWVEAFNAQLKVRATGESRVVLVDLYSNFNDYIAHPADYGLTNVTTPACPITGVGADGLPTYNFETCTDTALSAMTPPAGATGGANWWKTYAFADGFHPTPAVYLLAGQLLNRSLIQAGWL